MAIEDSERPEQEAVLSSPTIVTLHGERHTLWHVVDPAAPDADQPAVIKTFSSRWATREDVRRFVAEIPRSLVDHARV